MPRQLLRVLLLEDVEEDALQLVKELETADYAVEYERVYSKKGMLTALQHGHDWDIIISSYGMPGFSSTDALLLLLERNIDIPLIIVSNTVGETVAVESMKAGAHDFIMKWQLSRLGPAVAHALQRASAKRENRRYQQRLRELSAHLEEVRENERTFIAREIHDELGGLLTALKMDLRVLQRAVGERCADKSAHFSNMAGHIDEAIKALRHIITELRPSVLDDLGLIAAIEWQLSEFERRFGIHCTFVHDHIEEGAGDKHHEVALFRIFQESLNNIAKHAVATSVHVSLRRDHNDLLLNIVDNGVGIKNENKFKKGHYGILGMHERALSLGGDLEVCTANGNGTCVSLRLPICARDEVSDEDSYRR